MKTYISAIIAVLLAGCTGEFGAENAVAQDAAEVESAATDQAEELKALFDRARWGDGEAYLKLADCYRDGIGVKKDFLWMLFMVCLSTQHGGIENEIRYANSIPDGNEYKLCFDVVSMSSHCLIEDTDAILQQLTAIDNPDALAVRGIVTMEDGDDVEGIRLIRDAARQGSSFAELLLMTELLETQSMPDENELLQIADRVPLAYKLLAKACLEPDEYGNIRKEQAAFYLLKAEEKALLSLNEARWLLSYHKNGGGDALTEEDVRRLESFLCPPKKSYKAAAVDTVCIEE